MLIFKQGTAIQSIDMVTSRYKVGWYVTALNLCIYVDKCRKTNLHEELGCVERTHFITCYGYPLAGVYPLHTYAGVSDTQAKRVCSAGVYLVPAEVI